jgi:hypothetical protein
VKAVLERLFGSKGLREEERSLLEALLRNGDDPRSALLIEQVRRSQSWSREVAGDEFVLTLPYTTEDLFVDLPGDVVGPWAVVHDSRTGKPLRFRVEIARAGIFRCLRGRSDDMPWPRSWSFSEAELRDLPPLRLPELRTPEDCLNALRDWLQLNDLPEGVAVQCWPPASLDDLARLEAEQGACLPPSYRALLSVTDGLRIGNGDLLGTADLYIVDLDNRRWWVLATVQGESFVVTEATSSDDEPEIYLWPHDAPTRSDAHLLARDLRSYVADSLSMGSTS